jgi:hypothetical protein
MGTATPNVSAKLDVSSTSRGFLPPRMTHAQKTAIVSPVAGLTLWCTDCGSTGEMQVYNGSYWTNMLGSASANPTSNGTAVVSTYASSTTSTGTINFGSAVSGVTQIITPTVTTAGTYSISATANGVTFAASGTFVGAGAQDIVLTATGTPTAVGTHSFTLNTTPNCIFSRTTEVFVASVTSPNTNKIWMDRNLGASQVATAFNDALSYGDLYQWGRSADGHQLKTSATTSTLSSADGPGHGNFITSASDWRTPANNNLWQGVNGINNPCPSGYRLPTEAEFSNEESYFNPQSYLGAIASVLKLPMAGFRNKTGPVSGQGSSGYYWTSTISSTKSADYFFNNANSNMNTIDKAFGLSVRCIKN